MIGSSRSALVAALLAVLAATPAAANGKAQGLTPEAARAKVTLHDDPLEVEAVLSTHGVLRSTRGILRASHNDGHLRAAIDRRTGQTRFEVRQTVQYVGAYRNFSTVNFETASWPASASLRKLDQNPAHCDAIDPQSACFEELSFVVDEAELRRLAAQGSSGEAWAFKLKPRQGDEHRASLPRAEIAGLLMAVDDYRARSAGASSTAADAP
ncbi:hypothetical protein [Phenylobacterium sp.]|uniref:hypothetical protein n=1 Tax=Phenylobacterium sp. TaxID=1871053 RepID=UPI0025F8648B|nr:hypothetical protein [Phenylobacterium sp.]